MSNQALDVLNMASGHPTANEPTTSMDLAQCGPLEASKLSFLDLPPEIRNAIYLEYATTEGGYVFNAETRKLRGVGNGGRTEPINKEIGLTCKQVYQETRGLGFRANDINFFTATSDKIRVDAGMLQSIRDALTGVAVNILTLGQRSRDENRPEHPIDAILEEMAREYPKMKPLVAAVRNGGEGCAFGHSFGTVGSYQRKALFRAIEIASEHDYFAKWSKLATEKCKNILKLNELLPYWLTNIPEFDWRGMDELSRMMPLSVRENWNYPWINSNGNRHYTRGKYYLSAASLARQFISKLPKPLRLCLRQIRLHEDSLAVACPETHVEGLVEFCLENPNLRIERRVDLWRTVFQAYPVHPLYETLSPEVKWLAGRNNPFGPGLSSVFASNVFATWVMEALELTQAGMPEESFTLTFYGGEADSRSSEIFQNIIQRDAIMQCAWERFVDEELVGEEAKLLNYLKQVCGLYIIDGFPQAVKDIIDGSSFIRCDFDLGNEIWDVEKEFERFIDMDLEDIMKLRLTDQQMVQTTPPLPTWNELLAENILPSFFNEYNSMLTSLFMAGMTVIGTVGDLLQQLLQRINLRDNS